MKIIMNSKNFTHPLLLMSILCLSFNLASMEGEELQTDRKTNTAEEMELKQKQERQSIEKKIEAQKSNPQDSIRAGRFVTIKNEKNEDQVVTVEKKGFLDWISDIFNGITSRGSANLLRSETGKLNDSNKQFDFSSIVESYRKLDTEQKNDALEDSTQDAFDAYKKNLASANRSLSNAQGEFAKGAAEKSITELKENFRKNLTSLKTAIEKNKSDGTGMLNPDQHLLMIDSNGNIVTDLSNVENLGDITFKVITDAQNNDATNEFNLENARQEDRKNKSANEADAKKIDQKKKAAIQLEKNKADRKAVVSKNLIDQGFSNDQAEMINQAIYDNRPSQTATKEFLKLISDDAQKSKIMKAFGKDSETIINRKIAVLEGLNVVPDVMQFVPEQSDPAQNTPNEADNIQAPKSTTITREEASRIAAKGIANFNKLNADRQAKEEADRQKDNNNPMTQAEGQATIKELTDKLNELNTKAASLSNDNLKAKLAEITIVRQQLSDLNPNQEIN